MTAKLSITELCDRFERLYPGAVTDVLDDRGFEDQTLAPAIGPLQPGMKTIGVAFPVVGRPNRSVDSEENLRRIVTMLGDAPEDAVVMYDTNDDVFSHIGELSVVALKQQGCRGAVVEGGARDVSQMLEYDFPVFTTHETPADAVPRWELIEWGTRAVVGGVEVNPGDIVLGDVDGVVVIPSAIAEDVLTEAAEIMETENAVRDAVRAGTSPIDAYEEFGKF